MEYLYAGKLLVVIEMTTENCRVQFLSFYNAHLAEK